MTSALEPATAPEAKVCIECGVAKPIAEFGTSARVVSTRCRPCFFARRGRQNAARSETPTDAAVIFAASLRPRPLPVTEAVTIAVDLGDFLPKGSLPVDVSLELDDLDPLLDEFRELFLDTPPTIVGTVLRQVIDGELKPRMAVYLSVAGTCSVGTRFMAALLFVTTE